MKTKPDEALEEIWAIRRQIARKFDFDPRKQVAYYQQKQRRLGAKIYQPGASTATHILNDRADEGIDISKTASPVSYTDKRKLKTKRAK